MTGYVCNLIFEFMYVAMSHIVMAPCNVNLWCRRFGGMYYLLL